MHVIISGLNEQAALACLGHAESAALQWQPSSLFLAEAELATDDQQHQWVWLYRAPWSLMTTEDEQDSAALLHRWQVQQRAVLQLRRHLRRGLLLVNADRVSPQALAGHLGLDAAVSTGEVAQASPLSAVLAGVFEQLAPECWDLYEALEAAAWLPEGAPEFRTTRTAAPVDALPALLDLLVKGKRLPTMEAKLTEQAQVLTDTRASLEQVEQQLAQANTRHRELNEALANSRAEQQSASEENELLLAQMHQVQEELEKYYLDSQSLKEQLAERDKQLAASKAQQQKLDDELAASRKAATQADEARKQLAADIQRLQRQLADQNAELQSASEENELMLAQLHQVQEELENYYLANREILTAMGHYEHTLHRARRALGQMAAHA